MWSRVEWPHVNSTLVWTRQTLPHDDCFILHIMLMIPNQRARCCHARAVAVLLTAAAEDPVRQGDSLHGMKTSRHAQQVVYCKQACSVSVACSLRQSSPRSWALPVVHANLLHSAAWSAILHARHGLTGVKDVLEQVCVRATGGIRGAP